MCSLSVELDRSDRSVDRSDRCLRGLFMQAGLTGWANRSDRWQAGRTGWSSILLFLFRLNFGYSNVRFVNY